MPIDDRTTNRSYQLPNAGNLLLEDVPRLRAALQAIDADIFARYTKTEVDTLIDNLIQGAPGALDTLNELAAAMGDDPNFATTVTNQLALKANSADVYSKAEADARYVQGSTQAEMVFIATANQSVFTLTTAVINKPSALVTLDGVVQPTSEYSLNMAGTQLTLSEGVPVGTIVRVLALGVASAGAPADDTVTEPKLRTGAVSTRALAVGIAPVVASINGGPLAGFRNAIINGDFNVWVRGTSFTGIEYGPDRWFLGRTGTTRTTTRQAFTLGQTDVPGEPEFFCRHVVTSVAGASNFAVMAQRIENVRSFAGQQVTLSFWAKADGSKPIAVEFAQNFGTGGSPSAEVTALGVTKPTLSTSWQLLTVTVTLPSIAGKTLGSDNNSYLAIGVWMDAGSSFNARTSTLGQQSGTFDFSRFQLEPGSAATPFEGRPLGAEISLCERFYQEGTAVNWSYGLALNAVGNSFEFRTAMRAVPEIVLSGGAETNISSVGVIEKLPGNIGFSARGVPSANGATYWQRNYTADAELY